MKNLPPHTSGNWEIDFTDVKDGSVAIGVKGGWGAFARVVIEMNGEESLEGFANAQLVVTAPKLLVALKAWVEAEEESHREEQAHDPQGCRYCESVAAIAEAEGRSERTEIDLMREVVAELKKSYDGPTLEYPGYIAVPGAEGESISFGTANGTWGWSDTHGNSGESTLKAGSTVKEIVDYILDVWESQ